jgi:single-stranded DNA-binding protein
MSRIVLAGNVADDVFFGFDQPKKPDIFFSRTKKGDLACSFTLVVERKVGELIWMRINAYKDLAAICQTNGRLRKGAFVIVDGELVPRPKNFGQEVSIEVRASDIKFVNNGMEADGNEQRGNENPEDRGHDAGGAPQANPGTP